MQRKAYTLAHSITKAKLLYHHYPEFEMSLHDASLLSYPPSLLISNL